MNERNRWLSMKSEQETTPNFQSMTFQPPKCGAELEEGLTIGSNRTRRSIRDDEEDRRFEVDVATRELLVLDSEETYSPSTVCLPKMILPTLPLLMVTLCLLSVLITMSCTRKTYRKNPFP